MNLSKYLSKTGLNSRLTKLYKNPIILIVIVTVTVFTWLNFAPDKTECPAVLTYDEIKSALVFDYCLKSENTVTITALDNRGIVNAENIGLTIDTQQFTITLNETIEIPIDQSQTIYVQLVYSDACYKSNSGEVAYYIDRTKLTNCTGNSATKNIHPEVTQINEQSEITAIIEDHIKPKKKVANIKSKNSDTSNIVAKSKEKKQESKSYTSNTAVLKSQGSQTLKKSNQKVAYTSSKAQLKEAKYKKATPQPQVSKFKPSESTIITNTLTIKTTNNSNPKIEAKSEKIEVSPNEKVSEKPSSAEMIVESSAKPVNDLPVTNKSRPYPTESLFSTNYAGILKDCPSSVNSIVSNTDLFAISIKSNDNIKLYDVHCHANSNSKVTITLTNLGKTISSFTQHLNIGENQISLSALGELETNIPYIIEFKTENISDLNLYPLCGNNQHKSREIRLNYLDNAYAFYGITYHKE